MGGYGWENMIGRIWLEEYGWKNMIGIGKIDWENMGSYSVVKGDGFLPAEWICFCQYFSEIIIESG